MALLIIYLDNNEMISSENIHTATCDELTAATLAEFGPQRTSSLCDFDPSVERCGMTFYTASNNDCLSACLASLLGLPRSAVPHFGAMSGGHSNLQFGFMEAWLGARGLSLAYAHYWQCSMPQLLDLMRSTNPRLAYLLFGRASNGDGHVVICRGGDFLHDPAPDGCGVLSADGSGAFCVATVTPILASVPHHG